MRIILTVLADTFSLTLLPTRPARITTRPAARFYAWPAGGGGGCANYLNAYFSVAVFKGGIFKSGDTMSERGNFLDECSSRPVAALIR